MYGVNLFVVYWEDLGIVKILFNFEEYKLKKGFVIQIVLLVHMRFRAFI